MSLSKGMSAFTLDPVKLRLSLCGRRKLEPYEKLVKYYKKQELLDLCEVFRIKHSEKAKKIDLALLIIEKRPNFFKMSR